MKRPVKLEHKVWFSRSASPQLKRLRPVFDKLSAVHETYINAEPQDEISFWHGERAQVGLLAAAAFRAKQTALQEYPVAKRAERRAEKKADRRCPGDLYIRTDEATTFEFEVKAKTDVDFHKPTSVVEVVRDGLRRAIHDIRRHKQEGHCRGGLSFVSPSIAERWRDELEKSRRGVTSELKRTRSCDALVWIWDREPKARDKHFYPGLLVAVKQVRRRDGRAEYGNLGVRTKSA